MSGNGWNFGELAISKTSVLESSFIRNSTTRAVPREPFNRNDSIRESSLRANTFRRAVAFKFVD